MATATADQTVIKVKMAGLATSRAPDALETLLGSCVGVAIWDRVSKLGGLAHVVLPDSRGATSHPGKFADTAVAELRSQLISQGAIPTKLTAKIAGGSTMFGKRSDRDVGEKNCVAVREHLKKAGIRIVADHTGGDKGRMIRFSLDDGSVDVSIGRQVVATI